MSQLECVVLGSSKSYSFTFLNLTVFMLLNNEEFSIYVFKYQNVFTEFIFILIALLKPI